ncbi:hypothetical protein FQA39_LY18835 [Lamprigera yunnana]|nr:hypothetical protein FQA39_LY18835 [Lamprigera yunnana]
MSEGDTFSTSITINPPYEDVHAETDKNSDESDNKAFENVHRLPHRILLSSCSTNIEIVDDAQNVIFILEKRSIIATSSKGRRIRKELRILEKGKAVNFQVANVPILEQPNDNVLLKSLLNPIIPFNKFSPDEFLEEHLTPGDSDEDPTEPSAWKQKQQHGDLTPDGCDDNQTGPSNFHQSQSPRPQTPMTSVTGKNQNQ